LLIAAPLFLQKAKVQAKVELKPKTTFDSSLDLSLNLV